MTERLNAELTAICSGLGYLDPNTNKYFTDSNTLETAKDLIRYLRRDNETYDVRRYLGETLVLITDLIPLFKQSLELSELFDVVLRLLVNLTSPPLILWKGEIPSEKAIRNCYLQIEDHLYSYKQAFADEVIWSILSTKLKELLEIEIAERGEENNIIIERILVLIRNVVYVPTNVEIEKRPDNDANVHDQVLWTLHRSGILDIILYMASASAEQMYCIYILEILAYMFKEQSAKELANAAIQRSETEKLRDQAELLDIRHRENNIRQQKVKKFATRHSDFGGTFVVTSMKSISDNNLIYHKPFNNIDVLNFDITKQKPKTPKNRFPIKQTTTERRSAFSIRLFLKEFCVEFLNAAYNTFMHNTKQTLLRNTTTTYDEIYYLWGLRFFMEFNRCYKSKIKLISETVSIESFYFVQQQMEKFFDLMTSDKKKVELSGRRLHVGLLAYRELLLTICAMDIDKDSSVRESAKVIKSNLFYVVEYRELLLTLLMNYDELKLSSTYLKDLIETQHIFLKLFESYSKKYNNVAVQKISKIKRKRNKNTSTKSTPTVIKDSTADLQEMWNTITPQLSAILSERDQFSSDIVPFDAASSVSIDNQKQEAVIRIQKELRANNIEHALGLLRASREVWPENDLFGKTTTTPEEELLTLRDIFLADLNLDHSAQSHNDFINQEDEEEEDESDDVLVTKEINIKFGDFVNRYAHHKIIRACGLALKNFETNSVETNHSIIKLLHRISFDSKMFTMLFQLSMFRTFQKIFVLDRSPQYAELVEFSKYVMKQFFKVAESNNKVFIETLFWKNKRDAFDVENSYCGYNEQSAASKKGWTEVEENELRQLFVEHQEKGITEDVVDWIISNMIDNTKTRRNVLKKLKDMYLIINYKRKNTSKASSTSNWTEAEESHLTELYNQYKDTSDIINNITSALDVPKSRNKIISKLLELGLLQNIEQVRKKRSVNTTANIQNKSNPVLAKTKSRRTLKKNIVKVASIQEIMHDLKIVADMNEALEWLRESLSDIIEDREDNCSTENESIPLVPIMEPAVTAMINENFTRFIQLLGITRPENEQEIYWRVPGTLSTSVLQQYLSILTNALENNCFEYDQENGRNVEPNDEGSNQNESDDDDDIFDRLKNSYNNTSQIVEKNQKTVNSDSSDNEVEVVPHVENKTDTKEIIEGKILPRVNAVVNRKRIILESDSENEEPAEEQNNGEQNNYVHSDIARVKRCRIIISDDED